MPGDAPAPSSSSTNSPAAQPASSPHDSTPLPQ
jgi:hypothetical protein